MDVDGSMSLEDATCVVRRALLALTLGGVAEIELFTEDVIGDAPHLRVRSRSELRYQLIDREGALSNVEFDLDRVEVAGNGEVVARWRVAADHTGDVMFNEDVYFAGQGVGYSCR